MKKIKLNIATKKKIEKAIDKVIKEYGCVLIALQFDDEDFIKECEATGHKKYHNPRKMSYNLEINT